MSGAWLSPNEWWVWPGCGHYAQTTPLGRQWHLSCPECGFASTVVALRIDPEKSEHSLEEWVTMLHKEWEAKQ